MSCTAVKVEKEYIYLAAESFCGSEYEQDKIKDVKIWKGNSMHIACVGHMDDISLFRLFTRDRKPSSNTELGITEFICEFHAYAKKKDEGIRLRSSYFLIFQGKAFHIQQMQIMEVKTYQADGAGFAFAKAALYLGHNVKEAIAVACELSPYCEKPITVYRIKK